MYIQLKSSIHQKLASDNFFNGNQPKAAPVAHQPAAEVPRPAPARPTTTSSATQKKYTPPANTGPRIATLGSISSQEPEKKKGQNFYTGGGKSGLEVEGGVPGGNDDVDKLFESTKAYAKTGADEPKKEKKFVGKAYKLGDSNTPSEEIAPPVAEEEINQEPIKITFWKQGFTVADGPLRKYDDPASKAFMSDIERGYMPQELHKVGSKNEVVLENRKDFDYEPPAKPVKKIIAFSGQGNRLGSEPGYIPAAIASPQSNQQPSINPGAPAGGSDGPQARVQIRLGDGTTLRARFGLDQTIADVRKFIDAARPQFAAKAYIIMTPMPRVVFSDPNQTVKDANLDNSTIVQKFE